MCFQMTDLPSHISIPLDHNLRRILCMISKLCKHNVTGTSVQQPIRLFYKYVQTFSLKAPGRCQMLQIHIQGSKHMTSSVKSQNWQIIYLENKSLQKCSQKTKPCGGKCSLRFRIRYKKVHERMRIINIAARKDKNFI